jgi:deazaflavin-dependent oxidoreductase (nitroreductase family)
MVNRTDYFGVELADMIKQHLKSYLETDGADGYERDTTEIGTPVSLNLILRTIGRKSGRTLLTPLWFNYWNDDIVLVASKAGHDHDPSWFLNLTAAETVDVQVRDKRFRCTWRIAEGEEREKVWAFMADYYPNYALYQASTDRQIPVVMLKRVAQLEERFAQH